MITDTTSLARARQSVRAATIICIIVSAGADIGWFARAHLSLMQWHISLVINIFLCLITFIWKPKKFSLHIWLSVLAFSTLIVASQITNYKLAHRAEHFVPFAGYKLVALISAVVLPPPFIISYAFNAIVWILCVWQYIYMTAYLNVDFPAQEPWMTIVAFAVALAFIRVRIKSFELERKVMRVAEEARFYKKLATAFIALKDLANTPLQSIESTRYLLEQGKISATEASSRLDEALKEFLEFKRPLDSLNSHVDWDKIGPSFDALKLLNEIIEEKTS